MRGTILGAIDTMTNKDRAPSVNDEIARAGREEMKRGLSRFGKRRGVSSVGGTNGNYGTAGVDEGYFGHRGAGSGSYERVGQGVGVGDTGYGTKPGVPIQDGYGAGTGTMGSGTAYGEKGGSMFRRPGVYSFDLSKKIKCLMRDRSNRSEYGPRTPSPSSTAP